MEKQEFAALVSDLSKRYSCYANTEIGELKRAFIGMSSLLEKTVINYREQDMDDAAEAFFEKKLHEGHKIISYNENKFLRDPDAIKRTRTLTDFLYDTFSETITVQEVSKRTISNLANISLQYIWDVTNEGPRGKNKELVLAQNDTDNIILFCEVANYFKPDYAVIILAKAAELLELNNPQGEGISYAIKLRNYFVPGNTFEVRKTFIKIFGHDPLVEKSTKIQDNITRHDFELFMGNITDGDRQASGVLGYIEDNRNKIDFMEFQGRLHRYMDELLIK